MEEDVALPPIAISQRVEKLLSRLTATYDESYGTGSMSCAIYDTAWVSMIAKPQQSEHQRRRLHSLPIPG